MRVKKVIFPVGGLGTRFYPITKAIPKEMLGVLDKPLIHYAVEEALAADIEEFIFVTRQGKNSIEDYFDFMLANTPSLHEKNVNFCYVRQNKPLGLGHAIMCAKNLINNEPFAVMCADDFIYHYSSCIGEMIEKYDGKNMVAVMRVPRSEISRYGVIDVECEEGNLIFAKSIDEKPPAERAKSDYAVVGRYVLSHEIFEILKNLKPGVNDEIQLTDAILKMIPICGLVGFKFHGERFDCGSKEGLLEAILCVARDDNHLNLIIEKFLNKAINGQ